MEVESGKYDELLCGPPADLTAEGGKAQVTRSTAAYEDKGERFRVRHRAFDRQYAQTYFYRLAALRPRVLAEAADQWPGVPVRRILELQEGVECVLAGTLFKEMRLRPSVLDDYTVKQRGVDELAGRGRFTSDDDALVLEDDGARIRLLAAPGAPENALPVAGLVTGVVVAVRGTPVGSEFRVTAMAYPRPAEPQAPPPQLPQDRYVALVSGLAVGDDAANPLKLSLLADYLTGMLGAPAEQAAAGKVVRVIVAGGIVHSGAGGGKAGAAAQPIVSSGKQQAAVVAPLREADVYLTQLASLLPLDVMPGPADPSTLSLPQQPLHGCLFPGAARFGSFRPVTNPHEADVAGVSLLGTSGQNVDDVHRYSTIDDRLDIMEATLRWGHLVPTAPDSLAAYPFAETDPFVVERLPHVYFAGGQPEFACKAVEGPGGSSTLLVALPSFAATGTAALLNLRTLECRPVTFDAALQ